MHLFNYIIRINNFFACFLHFRYLFIRLGSIVISSAMLAFCCSFFLYLHSHTVDNVCAAVVIFSNDTCLDFIRFDFRLFSCLENEKKI